MKRRPLLAALGTSLIAGCSGAWREENAGTTDPAAKPTTGATERPTTANADAETRPDEPPPVESQRRQASVVELETTDRTVALTPANGGSPDGLTVAATFDAPATAERPTRLRATVRNPQEWAETASPAEVPLFEPTPSARVVGSDDATVWFAPTRNHPLARTVPDWERGPDGAWRLAGSTDEWLPDVLDIEAGERITGEYVLLSGADSSLEPGSYSIAGDPDDGMQLSVWPTSSPGPTDERSVVGSGLVRFEESDAPVKTNWYAEADRSTAVYLTPGADRIETPDEIEFTLTNRSDSRLSVGSSEWRLYKRHEGTGSWLPITRQTARTVGPGLLPGRTKTWPLAVFHGRPLSTDHKTGPSVGFIGGGRYAFAVRSSQGPDEVRAYAAAFEVTAPSVNVRPTEGVTAERDDNTVRVDATTDTTTEEEKYELVAVEDASRVLVPEQVMQSSTLRNTLSFARDGVECVALRSSASSSKWLDTDALSFVFEGTAFEIRRQ